MLHSFASDSVVFLRHCALYKFTYLIYFYTVIPTTALEMLQVKDASLLYIFSSQCCLLRIQTEWRTSHIYVHLRMTSIYEKCSIFSAVAHLGLVPSTISLVFCTTLSSISSRSQSLQETASMKVNYCSRLHTVVVTAVNYTCHCYLVN